MLLCAFAPYYNVYIIIIFIIITLLQPSSQKYNNTFSFLV